MNDEKERLTHDIGVNFICENKRVVTNKGEGKGILAFTFILITTPTILFYIFR
jgi:hypothetical protein